MQLKELPSKASTTEKYFENFQNPLLEEVREGLHKTFNSIGATSFQKIRFVHSSRNEDPRFTFLPLDSREEKYRVSCKPTDVIILASGKRPRNFKDLPHYRDPHFFVLVNGRPYVEGSCQAAHDTDEICPFTS